MDFGKLYPFEDADDLPHQGEFVESGALKDKQDELSWNVEQASQDETESTCLQYPISPTLERKTNPKNDVSSSLLHDSATVRLYFPIALYPAADDET